MSGKKSKQSGEDRLIDFQFYNHAAQIGADRIKAVTVRRRRRFAESVAALIERDNSILLRQYRRDPIPNFRVRRQPVNQNQGPPLTTPVAQVKAEGVGGEEEIGRDGIL